MSQNGGDASKASSPGRPRHQIRRSISEISSPIRLHRQPSHRAAREAVRDFRTPGPQSAVQGRRSFEWSARSAGVTPNLTPSVSRRTSILYASADEGMPATKVPTKDNGSATGLAREQQKAVTRESGLQRSLAELDSFASATTKQLDDIYYSYLEKLSALQNTVAALRELSEHSRQLNSSFEAEADDVVADISAQLEAFGQFEDQQNRIESLQSRIHAGRELIASLSERVDAVSERIERWERADWEWQEKTRKRLKTFWVVTSVVVFLVLALFIGSQYAPEGLEGTTARIAGDGLHTLRDVAGEKADVLRSSHGPGDAESQRSTGSLNSTGTSGIQSLTPDVLRVFDEL